MSVEKIYKDADSVTIDVTMSSNVSNALGVSLIVLKPSGNVVEWAPAEVLDDGFTVRYVTQAGDLNEAGAYYAQPYFIDLDGFSGYGSTFTFAIWKKFT